MLQRCPGPDTIWLLPLGPLLLTLYSDGKEEESRKERLSPVRRRLNTLPLALVVGFIKVPPTLWKSCFRGVH